MRKILKKLKTLGYSTIFMGNLEKYLKSEFSGKKTVRSFFFDKALTRGNEYRISSGATEGRNAIVFIFFKGYSILFDLILLNNKSRRRTDIKIPIILAYI